MNERQKAAGVRDIFQPCPTGSKPSWSGDGANGDRRRLIAMHSFTPVFKGVARRWRVGLLYNRDPRLAQILIALLKHEVALVVGDNEPYSVTDESDYTIPV